MLLPQFAASAGPRDPAQRREEPISAHALDSAPAPLDASPSLLPLAARPSGRKAGSGSLAVSSLLCVVFVPRSRSRAAAATRVAARSLREALHKPSGGREASSPARRRRLGSQHGGGGGGGPGDGPRAGVRRGAALHQPLVHRRGRLRHGLVSVYSGLQARPHPVTPACAPGCSGRSRGPSRALASRSAATWTPDSSLVHNHGARRGLVVAGVLPGLPLVCRWRGTPH